MDILSCLPTDVSFDIAILCGNYKDDYCAIAALVPVLNSEERRSQARKMLTVCRQKYSGHRVVEEHYTLDGMLHREDDLPADIEVFHDRRIHLYYKFGVLHRDGDLPAVTRIISRCEKDEYEYEYYKHGVMHRDGDLPAYIILDFVEMWYKNGKRHRENNLPALICKNPERNCWYFEGKEYTPYANWSFGVAMCISMFIVGAFIGDVIAKNNA